ncbi:alpha/beta fold hydrolase [Sphingomonas astaxanthinifaciens]|uniref:Alpha/beta hydrolase n=1 Tax=Sphingomonas astaxanthinifaciens DSM 22298 TaxID=1123267 RepID=A0ABQ5Z4L7_9SPHN|nr:alpha/beta hydrolase [Sphingomonas astaxanthinifaciens]GLR46481.1 alpha/beta hydrolase [Sphingomonas astaxanthinifaciens DSM 22298]
MTDLTFTRHPLATGVTLNVATAGPEDGPAIVFLHGFPESHRTWRKLVPLLSDKYRLIMPDQRGFAGSDAPPDKADYATDRIVADLFALVDRLGLDDFTLVGHDWGGAVSWAAALRNDPRLKRLVIVNAPHPVIFQKSLIEDSDQRAASQYMNAFRAPGFEDFPARIGWEAFFDKSFEGHVDLASISPEEKADYIAEWSRPGTFAAMLNWYRGAGVIVPQPGIEVPLPDFLLRAFPSVKVPTLVVWGMRDKALLPLQFEGLDALVDDLTLVRVEDAGHFLPWEKPEAVAGPLRTFLASHTGA